jgi:DTW domain-containing protein YfiP
VCYCAAIPTIETTTRIVILQHLRERDMPIGTARTASHVFPRIGNMKMREVAQAHPPVRPAHPTTSIALSVGCSATR